MLANVCAVVNRVRIARVLAIVCASALPSLGGVGVSQRDRAASSTSGSAAPEPSFSHAGGFYTEPFELTLSVTSADAEIRFTLDGTEPTSRSALYQQPLRIESRQGTPNKLSSIPTVVGGPTAAGEVFKSWVVRARCFKPGLPPSPVMTSTFWIDARGRGRYSLPVVSIVTDPAHLFDRRTGIYVPGRMQPPNYLQKGPQWIRPAHVELYETNNSCAFSQDVRIKIHGNTSQMWPIKGLDLEAADAFRYPLFPDRARNQFKHFLLRPSGQDQQVAFMRDELAESLAAEAGLDTQAARACVVFIDGEYWGLNYLKEKEDAQFVSWTAGRGKRQLDYIEDEAKPRSGDANDYQALIDYVKRHNLNKPECYAHVVEAIDITNYINYISCEIFAYRWDINQHRSWRPRTAGGRWRWLSFDYDVAWGGFWSQSAPWRFNMLAAELATDGSLHGHNTEASTLLLRRLIENPDFRRAFVNRFEDLLNTVFLPSHTLARIDKLSSALAPEMDEHIRRWRAPASVLEWKQHIDELRTYARQRPQYVREQLRLQFGLDLPCKVAVSVNPPEAGAVRLNTISIPSGQTNGWSGLYFKRYPISLEAEPATGFRFDSWVGATNSSSNRLVFAPQGDCALTARFLREKP